MFEVARLRTLFNNKPEIKDRIVKRYKLIVDEYNSRNLRWYWSKHKLDQLIKDEFEGHKGKWVTINGKHIFIREGESLEEATQRLKPSKEYRIEGQKDETEAKIIRSALKKLPKEDLEGINKITIVDEADFYRIGGDRIKCDASFTKSTGELRIERYLLTDPELNRVMYHEVAHNKWRQLSLSDQGNWNNVYHRGLKMGYKFPSFYATKSAEEAFAECYAFDKDGRSGKVDGIFMSHLRHII